MKRLIFMLTVLVAGIFLTVTVFADDVDDVKSAVQAFYEALNNGDAEVYFKFTIPEHTHFPRTGGLLTSSTNTSEERTKELQDMFDAGLNFDVQVHHLDVKNHGNMAVSTYYTTGTTTYPDGTVLQGTFRASLVWLKQAGQWKIAHMHISRLETEPR